MPKEGNFGEASGLCIAKLGLKFFSDEVEGSCSQMHGTFLDVQSVYRVTSPGAVQRRYQETLGLLHAPTDMQLQNLFHGTTESAMLSICQHGFDPDHASFRGGGGGSGASAGPKMFGNGLYLATNAVGALSHYLNPAT